MYRVFFHKYVFDAARDDPDAQFAVLTREESLPFAPVPGQEIQWPLERSQKILASAWSTQHGGFRCRVEDEYTASLRIDDPDFDEYIEDAPERGWTVESVHPAGKR